MDNDSIAPDISEAQNSVTAALDDVSGIETDAVNWGDGSDSVEDAAGGAREALQLLSKALVSAFEQVPDEDGDE